MREIQIFNDGVPFYAPFANSELIKAEEEGSNWVVYLEASNEKIDQDGEVTIMKALKDASDHYLKNGVLSWDHCQKTLKDPSFIIGEPTDVAFTNNNSTLVKGILYKENKKAQGVWENILSKSTRLGASIGGYILNKSKDDKACYIKKIYWDETAITNKPVNNDTMGKVSLLPFSEFAKALMAGSGVNPANFSSGRALTGESLQGNMVKPVTLKDLKGLKNMEIDQNVLDLIMKGFLKKVQAGHVNSMQDVRVFIEGYRLQDAITDQITDFLIDKINSKENK